MKKWLAAMLSALVVVAMIPAAVFAGPSNMDDNTFDEPAVEKAVLAALGKEDINDVTFEEAAKITELSISGNFYAGSLRGLENLTGLKVLKVNNTGEGIQDLSFLKNLPLEELSLSGNKIQDLSPLAGITTLTTLNLADNNIEDLSPLKGLTNITSLNLALNGISDLSALSGMSKLTSLNLEGNMITENSLSNLPANFTSSPDYEDWKNALLGTQGQPHAHQWSDEWSYNGNNHWKTCTVDGCNAITQTAAHKGGVATCTEKAVCEVCGQAYGKVDANNHKSESIQQVEKVDATAEKAGNIEYWYCADCKKYYKDADLTQEITKDQTVIAATAAEEEAAEETKTENPKTSDPNAMGLWFVLMAVSACALAGSAYAVKRHKA